MFDVTQKRSSCYEHSRPALRFTSLGSSISEKKLLRSIALLIKASSTSWKNVSHNVVSGGSVELIPSGYLHPAYAEALSEFGKPRLLPSSGGVVLQRHIRNSSSLDGMGCY